jgi:hypothetical protein
VKAIYLLVMCIIITACIAGGFTGCAKTEGNLPQLSTGDKWVSRWNTGGEEYTVTAEIIGEEYAEGKDCYIMETTFEPPFMGTLTGVTNRYDKATMNIVAIDMHSTVPDELTNATYRITGTPFYPLAVGKEIEEVELMTLTSGNSIISSSQNSTTTTVTKVEKIEKITTEAGTFRCYKLLKYDQSGNLLKTTWRSEATKFFQVKMIDMTEEDAVYELISYTVK